MTLTILIDGPSGSGKTTAAARLGATLGIRVIHMDDIYPGWEGLAAASAILADSVLAVPAVPADAPTPGFHRWDWERSRPGKWVPVDPSEDLIVEGVGALSAASAAAARRRGAVVTWALWGPNQVRKERALRRDPGYAPYWETWARQEAQHFAAWARDGVVPQFLSCVGPDGDLIPAPRPVNL